MPVENDLVDSEEMIVVETVEISSSYRDSTKQLPSMVELPIPVVDATIRGTDPLRFSRSNVERSENDSRCLAACIRPKCCIS